MQAIQDLKDDLKKTELKMKKLRERKQNIEKSKEAVLTENQSLQDQNGQLKKQVDFL